MKGKSIVIIATGLIAMALMAAAIAYACGGQGCPFSQASGKDIKVDVKKVANGVVVTMTADKPEVVKAIQAHAANCAKGNHACGLAPNSDACKKPHESGACPGHTSDGGCGLGNH